LRKNQKQQNNTNAKNSFFLLAKKNIPNGGNLKFKFRPNNAINL
jgi:hypothetical protein